MKKLVLTALAGAIGLALAFALLPLFSGGDGGVRAAESDPIGYIGIDMDPTGNVLPSSSGPGSLGAIDRCISVSSAGNPTIYVDVYTKGIPLDEEATAYSYQLNWAPDNIDVINPITEGMLSFGYYDGNPGNNNPVATCPYGECENENLNPGHANTITQAHEPRPRLVSPWNAGAGLLTPGEQSFNGDQVITRIGVKIQVPGPQLVNLWLAGPVTGWVADDESVGKIPTAYDGAANPVKLAIDRDCPFRLRPPDLPGTPFQRGLQEAIANRQAQGLAVPDASYEYEAVVEDDHIRITSETTLDYDGPEEAGVDVWPSLEVEQEDPGQPCAEGYTCHLEPGNYDQAYHDYLEAEFPGIWDQYEFGKEPRTHIVDEVFDITYPEASPGALEQLAMPLSPSATIEDVVMGLTLGPPRIDWTIHKKVRSWGVTWFEARAGFLLDVGVGLRLPVNVTLNMPDLMTAGQVYTLSSSLKPLDWSQQQFTQAGVPHPEGGDEFLLRFNFFLGVKVIIVNVEVIGWYLETNFDRSKSFTTPFGTGASFPIPELVLTPDQTGLKFSWHGASLGIGLKIDPDLGSDKITSHWQASGDASGSDGITYKEPQTPVAFGPVTAGDFSSSTNYATVTLSDFRYYFSIFLINLSANIQLGGWLSFVPDTPYFHILTLDLSDLTSGLYLGVHPGTDGKVEGSALVQSLADVKIVSQSFVSPPTDIDVSENKVITLRKILHDNGPSGPVEVEIQKTATAPAGCTVNPGGPISAQVVLPTSVDVSHDEQFTIHCTTKSTHGPFIFNNQIVRIKDPNVIDPVPGNNSKSTQLTVNVWALADLKIVSQYVATPPTQITMSQDVPITVKKVLHNNGPFAPVSATTNTVVTVPPDCTVSPTSHVQQYSGLPVSVDVVHTEPFVIHCTKPSTHKFSFDGAITPKDPHVRDPVPGNNTAHTELTVAAVTQTDVKIVGETFTVRPPKPLPLNTDVDVTLRKTIHNNGSYGPVDIANDGKVWPSHPQLCTAVPRTVPPVIYAVPVSTDVVVDEVWTIRCTVAGDYSFAFDNWISVATAHVSDFNPANNIAHLELRDDVAPVDTDRDGLTNDVDDDDDGDGFADLSEVYMGTDPLAACPNDAGHAAWPLDQDNNGQILIPDVTRYTGKLFTSVTCPGGGDCRLDLDANGYILIGDVTRYTGKLFATCP